MSSTYHKLMGLVLSLIKGIWSATIAVVWGIASIFLLTSLITYYKVDASAVAELLIVAGVIMAKWVWFFTAFLIYDTITNFKEWLKPIVPIQLQTKTKEVKL